MSQGFAVELVAPITVEFDAARRASSAFQMADLRDRAGGTVPSLRAAVREDEGARGGVRRALPHGDLITVTPPPSTRFHYVNMYTNYNFLL